MKKSYRILLALVGVVLVGVVAFGAGMMLSNPAATNKAAATEPETAFFATVAPTQAPVAEDTIVVVDRTASAAPAAATTPAPVATPATTSVTPLEPAVVLVSAEATQIPDSDIGDWTVQLPMNAIGLYRRDPDRALTKFRDTDVTRQQSAAAYAKAGMVVGHYANVHALAEEYLSTVPVVRYEVVNWGFIPQLKDLRDQQELVSALIGLVTRTQGNHQTLNCEVYDKNVHIAVANLWVGGQAQEYWTIFVRADGVYTLACKGGSSKKAAPATEDVVPAAAPAATPKPQQNVDPQPVFEDASAPETPVGGNDGWDPAFNLPSNGGQRDPAPVFEGASAPETPVQTSSNGSGSGNTNPAPVFETSTGSTTNTNPAAVFEGSTSSASSDTSAQGWDPAFNF